MISIMHEKKTMYQFDGNKKQMTRKRAFSHAFGSFPVFTLSSH